MLAISIRAVFALVPPAVFGVGFVVVWELAVKLFDLKPYFVPAPTAIAEAFVDNFTNVRKEPAFGWAISPRRSHRRDRAGRAGSVPADAVQGPERVGHPAGGGAQCDPDRRAGVDLHHMYPATSEMPRRLMVTLIVFFIVLVNVAKGLRQVQPAHLELLRSYAATPVDVLRKARVPNAVPYLFTALKIAAPTSVITAFVAEYFGGSQNGLGNRITSNMAIAKNAVAWAYVLGACLLGLSFFLVSVALESIITHSGVFAPGEIDHEITQHAPGRCSGRGALTGRRSLWRR